jgi:hypothetical protein
VEDPAGDSATPGVCAVTLALAGGRVAAVRIGGRGLERLRGALAGRAAAEAPRLARRLFPVCGIAQEIACIRAVEAAEGRAAEPGIEARRARLLDAEAAFGHVWRAAIDWPRSLGRAPATEPVKAARAALVALEADPGDPVPARRLAALLADDALFRPGEAALAARLGARLALPADPPLGARPPAWFAARLAAGPGFAACPEAGGAPADPLERHGAGETVGARLDALRQGAATLAGRLGAAPAPEAGAGAEAREPGTGCGLAMTARGPLAWLVRLSEGRVADARAVAPTEWLTHPSGALARALGTLAGGAVAEEARALLALFDPCSEVALDLREAADA